MTRDHVDLRVRRTHANLREALIDLIEEKGFDAVPSRRIWRDSSRPRASLTPKPCNRTSIPSWQPGQRSSSISPGTRGSIE